jgi:LAGLIDADG-like domain
MLISKQDVVDRYLSGMKTAEIAVIAGCSVRYIRKVLTQFDVERRHLRREPTFSIDINFFKEWSPEMAYVLGFILTDGCINHNSVSIAQKDKQILERINTVMKSNYPIKQRKNGNSTINLLVISRKEVVEDLAKFGILNNKSLTVDFPEVPLKYLSHFIRGVIDGDGWVQDRGYVMNVTSGSLAFAFHLHETLNYCGFNGRITKHGKFYRVWVSGKDDIIRLGRWLYGKGCGDLYLPRKRERFEINDVITKKDAI